jgi:hypothetical protein
MNDARKLARIMFLVVVLFICNKLILRPYVLKNEFPEFVNVFVLSFPNLCEAVVGGLLLTNIGLYLKHKYLKAHSSITEHHVYLFAVLLTAVYVLLQELKVHNLGGNNVYDPFDMLFSVMGMGLAYFLLLYLKPRILFEQKNKSS